MDTLRDNFREGNSPETIEIQGSHSLRALEHTHFLRNIKALTADFPDVPSLKELGRLLQFLCAACWQLRFWSNKAAKTLRCNAAFLFA